MPPSSPGTLGDQRAETQHALYVGRERELAQIGSALAADALPFHVVHVYGPGGIGKTSLLDEVARLAEGAGVHVGRVDARDLEPSPRAFEAAASAAWSDAEGRRVLLVDTYERVEPLDAWVRRTFVPGLRTDDLVVIAGRRRPSAEWRAEWGGHLACLPLRDLSAAEARRYLGARGVPAESRDAVTTFTRGHPLALALAADYVRQHGAGADFDATQAPHLVADLLARFVETAPSPAHRAALEGASVVRSLTVPLLRALLDAGPSARPSASELFEWLRGLTFVASDADGLRLHDVVRETVEADLMWRDADRHHAFHVRARRHYGARLRDRDGDPRQTLADYLDLYRHNPVVQPLLRRLALAQNGATPLSAGPLREGDAEGVRALVAQHHGAAEAQAVAGWLARRPGAAEVLYDADGTLRGFLLTLDLSEIDADERALDPVVASAWRRAGDGLREGERALLFRSWLDAEAGQGVSVAQSLIFARTVEHYLSTPGLATSVLLTAEPDLWGVVLSFAGLHRWPDAEADGGPAAFGRDWRASPPAVWLDEIAERTPGTTPPPPDPADTLVVLSQDAFADAVRDALKAYARPHRLAESPLVGARLVRELDGDPVEALRQRIADAAAQLDAAPRERPYFRALDVTYLDPAPTQAQASERLGVPFSTYRRHLGRGVDHVVEALWRAETGDDRPG